MATRHPRVQVTVDPEFAEALAAVEPGRRSRSRVIRDLALRGATSERDERQRRAASRELLLRVVRGDTEYDPATAAEIHAEREGQAD